MFRSSFKRFQSTTVPPPGKKPTGIRALMKEYGLSALGIYLALTAIDLPLFYLLVHSVGKDEIEYYENKAKQQFGYGVSDEELSRKQEISRIEEEEKGANETSTDKMSWFEYIKSQFSLTEFILAYGVHKAFIFIRLPIAAAITPTVVKTLRGWGFKLGSQSVSKTAEIAKSHVKDYTASNPKFGTRGNRKRKWFDFFF
ncbi:hypothetical protein CLIB1444_10S01288 [[Candida] jaroonii]|uniref:Uncharacterized protein n=1 Tax=[Candida] jaroonii TaxID=467808 RepID=A0ACA9YCD0_9ASCO|nr:hypothetical protein CLIB1444_10S01288 [[Candida] jaroonii]